MICPHDNAVDVSLPARTDDAEMGIFRCMTPLVGQHEVTVALMLRSHHTAYRAHSATIDNVLRVGGAGEPYCAHDA